MCSDSVAQCPQTLWTDGDSLRAGGCVRDFPVYSGTSDKFTRAQSLLLGSVGSVTEREKAWFCVSLRAELYVSSEEFYV